MIVTNILKLTSLKLLDVRLHFTHPKKLNKYEANNVRIIELMRLSVKYFLMHIPSIWHLSGSRAAVFVIVTVLYLSLYLRLYLYLSLYL